MPFDRPAIEQPDWAILTLKLTVFTYRTELASSSELVYVSGYKCLKVVIYFEQIRISRTSLLQRELKSRQLKKFTLARQL